MSNLGVGGKFWMAWVLVCIGGGFASFILGLIVFTRNQNVLSTVVGLSIVGILWGTPQYLLLKNYTAKINISWILVSVAGIIASLYVAVFIFAVLEKNISWALIGATGATFQYLVLRQHFSWSIVWIIANGVSVTVSRHIGEVVFKVVVKAIEGHRTGYIGDSGLSALALSLSALVQGLTVSGFIVSIYGTITGGTLVWLVHNPSIK